MTPLKTMDCSILTLIILAIIAVNTARRSEKKSLQSKLFINLVELNIILNSIDILSWVFNGKAGIINLILNSGFNLLLFIIEPLVPIVWILYTNLQVFRNESRIRRPIYLLSVVFLINAFASVVSLKTGWFFYVTSSNTYHRGTCYWIHILICLAFLIYSSLFVAINRKQLEKNHYYALLLFPVPPIIGTVIQASFYGVSLSWCSLMISLLTVYFYIQNRSINTDYLTGVYNRRQLDYYLKKKIRECTNVKSFSVILIDMNDFKQINDSFGHIVGDEALRNSVKIIQSCLSEKDFIARYGGDEFYIILDSDDVNLLKFTVNRIDQAIYQFNQEHALPYRLSFCMGYDIYPYEKQPKPDEFLKHIDMLMYENKLFK